MEDSIQPQMKRCSKCGEMKPVTAFYRDRFRRDGYHSSCKACHRSPVVTVEEYIPPGYKKCSRCQEIKPLSDFTHATKSPDGYNWSCRKCISITIPKDILPEGYRRCSRCREVKPLDDFYRSSIEKSGYYSSCKACWRLARGATSIPEILPEGMKRCTQCQEVKPLTEFTNRRKGGSTKLPKCKECHRLIDKDYRSTHRQIYNQKGRRDYHANKHKNVEKRHKMHNARNRKHKLSKKYGLTVEQYDDMYTAQFGLCAICGLVPKDGRLVVDHCHVSSVVRGLLCTPCNTILGMARDNAETLRNAIKYLRKHQS